MQTKNIDKGHLKKWGHLELKQSDKTKDSLSKSSNKYHSLKKLNPVKIDWKFGG